MFSSPPPPVVELDAVVKDYRGLRPLRIAALRVAPGERVVLAGFDASAAEVFVNLVTGATLPDTGRVVVTGRQTSDITDADHWFAWLVRFGIVTPRAVLLDAQTVRQNLAIPFTLAIDELDADVSARVDALARSVRLDAAALAARVSDVGAAARLRIHLAKAIALDPEVLLVEHPTADVEATLVPDIAADLTRLCEQRHLTAVIVSNDAAFTQAVATRVLTLAPASGRLETSRRWTRWFGA